MQRGLLSLSRLCRSGTVQPGIARGLWTATRSIPTTTTTTTRTSTAPSIVTRPAIRMASSSSGPPAPIRFSEGEDTEEVTAGVNALRQQGWQLNEDGMGLTKTYYFKSYFKAVSFVNVVAAESAAKKHHPVITVRIGSVDVHWTTHQPRGLSQRDVKMAHHCEEGAELMGAVAIGQGQKCG